MHRLFTIILCFFTLSLFSQTSKLQIDCYLETDTKVSFFLLQESDTVYSTEIVHYLEDPILLDSLEAGAYKLHVYDFSNQEECVWSRSFLLEEDKQTNVYLNLNFSEYVVDNSDTLSSSSTSAELQVGFGYFNSQWLDKSSALKNNFSFSYSAFGWTAFTKHFGLLYGGGFGISQHYFNRDTTLFLNIPHTKKTERYASILVNYEMKVRFSAGNQKSTNEFDISRSKLFIDLGAGYYLPLLFNHTAVYKGSKKFIDRNIHKFNDFRAFVNIGFAPVSFYAEYRLSDFVRGNNPQLPRLHTGIRLVIPMD